jgi:hypothetical protein
LGYPGDESFNQVVDTAKAYLNWDAQRTKAEIDQVMKIFAIPQ